MPGNVLYGASTQRAVLNFPISGRAVSPLLIRAVVLLKTACAATNLELKKLDQHRFDLIHRACEEIAATLADGSDPGAVASMMQHFPIDIFQTGSGTSTNMNVNEVIATAAATCIAVGKVSLDD